MSDSHSHRTAAYNLEQHLRTNGILTGSPGMADGANYSQRSRIGNDRGYVCYGRVLDAVANSYCYRVALENNGGIWPCLSLVQTSAVAFGAKQLHTIPLGSMVWVIRHPNFTYGQIIGVEPSPATSAALTRNDMIHQSSRCGVQVDQVHYKLYDTAGGIIDASAGRPLDVLCVGEAGWQSETGTRIYLDSFMAQLAVDEACGIFAFYHDQLLRVAGLNLEEFSAQHVRQLYDDEGECYHVEGYAVYPWEQYGATKPDTETLKTNTAQDVQATKQHYAAMEPKDDDQQPFHRVRLFRGYLGQGGKRMVSLPPKDEPLARLSGTGSKDCVFAEQIGLTGAFALRSAKAITICKRPAIPNPVQRQLPADPGGDKTANYKASGQFGEGPEHKVKGQFRQTETKNPALQTAAGVLDYMAQLFAWDGAHPFTNHKKDWTLPSESETTVGTNQEAIDFASLQRAFYLQPPEPIMMSVDHRYGQTKYYPNTSGFTLLEDGGVLIFDGFGSSITMTAGHIFFDAPGDIWLRPGRNLNCWAGQDVVMRARNSMDLSTTNKDVRIKAEKNMHVVAGAGGEAGGLLVEVPTPTTFQLNDKQGEDVVTGGIVFKAAKGMVTTLAKDIYLRTGGGDVEAGGVMMLDAGKGDSPLIVQADRIEQFVTTGVVTAIGKDGTVNKASMLTAAGLQLDCAMQIEGGIYGKGDVIFDGSVVVLTGLFAGEQDPPLGVLKPENALKLRGELKKVSDLFKSARKRETAFYEKQIRPIFYETDKPGEDDLIRNLHFTFRTEAQYGTQDAVIFESYWQQLARAGGGGSQPWEEKTYNGTWPYPGEKAHNSTGFCQQPLELYDVATGTSKDPASASGYEDPAYAAPTPSGLNQSYLTNGR